MWSEPEISNPDSKYESESTLFSLNPNSYSLALNVNPNLNLAEKALNPDSNLNRIRIRTITVLNMNTQTTVRGSPHNIPTAVKVKRKGL